MPVETLPADNPSETAKKEEKEEVKPTLEDIAKQNKELNDKISQVVKQNSDKDSFISTLQKENSELRSTVQKVTTSLSGKTEKQKDDILESYKSDLLNSGYDEGAVDKLINMVSGIADKIADRKVKEQVIPMIMDSTESMIESDSSIDKDFLKNNSAEIQAEYQLFRAETNPRKIHQNLKKAYNTVRTRLAEKAKADGKDGENEKRENMLFGGTPPQKGKKEETPKDDFLDRIDKAGPAKGHFV